MDIREPITTLTLYWACTIEVRPFYLDTCLFVVWVGGWSWPEWQWAASTITKLSLWLDISRWDNHHNQTWRIQWTVSLGKSGSVKTTSTTTIKHPEYVEQKSLAISGSVKTEEMPRGISLLICSYSITIDIILWLVMDVEMLVFLSELKQILQGQVNSSLCFFHLPNVLVEFCGKMSRIFKFKYTLMKK